MFRLYDITTGRPEPVRPGRPGWLRTCLASPAQPGRIRTGDLRAALIGDLIRRTAERHHLHVTAWQWEPGGPEHARASLRAVCEQLNIHPPQPASHPPGPADVGVSAPGHGASAGTPRAAGHAVAIGDREAQGSAGHWLRPAGPSPDDVLPADLTARGLDPLALRLALLRHHHQQPAAVGWDMLAAADEALRAWRRQVAGWALSPSKPMRAQYVADVTGAFDDDLRTPAALAALDALGADGAIPPGSKFEAFAYTDQLLGLDLARDVGR